MSLELNTSAGHVNEAVLAATAGVAGFRPFMQAGGAFFDRIIYLILLLKNREPEDGAPKTEWVDRRETLVEIMIVALVGLLCLASLHVAYG